jgi:hypothetical protein
VSYNQSGYQAIKTLQRVGAIQQVAQRNSKRRLAGATQRVAPTNLDFKSALFEKTDHHFD